MLEKLFHLSHHKTNAKTEVLAGTTTFLAMAYILAVNPSILSESGMSVESVFLATAIASGFASILMGLLANYPIGLAPGMGVNAFFTYTVCVQFGYSWQAALAAIFVSGVILVLISLTGLREMIINAIPQQLKLAIGAGIGFFIAFVGLKNAGIVVANVDTFVTLGKLTQPTVALALFGLIITLILLAKKVKAAVFWGLVTTAIIGVLIGLTGVQDMPQLPTQLVQFQFSMPTFNAFASGFQELFSRKDFIVVIFSFLFVGFFDTAGALLAIASRANLVKENGELENVKKVLLSDSIGTVVGAVLGTSTVTSFVESTSGVEVGGRTGLTAVVTGCLFLLAIIFFPVLSVVTSAVTAPALIVIGVLMAQQLGEIEWDDFVCAASSFVTILMMVLCYSISNGIALGFITFGAVMVGSGKRKEVKPIIWILDLIFIIYFIV